MAKINATDATDTSKITDYDTKTKENDEQICDHNKYILITKFNFRTKKLMQDYK